jgi:HNH endonuclease
VSLGRKLRAEAASRAGFRCEYCLIHEDDAGFPHQADHIMSVKHGGATHSTNLAYACVLCNRHKGSDIASIDPGSGELVKLFNPRLDNWSDHFQVDAGWIIPISKCGEATTRLLRLNAPERMAERRMLQALGRYPAA